ncbi:MAG: PspC domain-containing protein [Acidobacteriaceae bacterium]|nr:PspC domain-containing protein [Acidobacteriaceae bacterium]
MNCQGCGKPIEPGARFCSGCGRAVPLHESFARVPTRFVRPREGRMIAGVCAGIAQAYGWDVTPVRLILALIVVLGAGSPFLAYLVCWIVMPNAEYEFVPPPSTPPPGNMVV